MSISFLLMSFNKDNNTPLVLSFINDLTKSDVRTKEITDKYLCKIENSDLQEVVLKQLSEVKEAFKNKQIKEYRIIRYRNIPDIEKNILIDSILIDNVYIIKNGSTRVLSLLVENNKISAFVTMKKGENIVFFKICP